MIQIEAPFTEEKIRGLKVGDRVELTGLILTGRDAVHKWLHEGNRPPFDLRNSIIYHCGPVVVKRQGQWKVVAAGPTTSIREEPYQADLFEKCGIRGVIGKGGMGERTREACARLGCVYLHAIGGAAQVLAERIVEVEDVFGLEQFGSPEAIWRFRVAKFPVVVTMDSMGRSLHKEIETQSATRLKEVLARLEAK